MPLIDLNAPPSQSMLRWFGLSLGIALAMIAFLLAPPGMLRQGVLFSAGLVATVYYLMPQTRLTIIRAWQLITFPLAWTVGHLLFGTVFFLVLTPIGFTLRALGYDPLRLSKKRQDKTQWIDRAETNAAEKNGERRHFRQY